MRLDKLLRGQPHGWDGEISDWHSLHTHQASVNHNVIHRSSVEVKN